jgi:hypothetical protein
MPIKIRVNIIQMNRASIIMYFSIINALFYQLQAQEAKIEYPFKHYTVQDGLVQMQIQALYQDSKGYLWCGTKLGISRFDGRNFKNYTSLDIKQDGPTNYFREDENNNLLIFNRSNFSCLHGDSAVSYPYPEGFQFLEESFFPTVPCILQLHKDKKIPWNKIHFLNYQNPDSLYITELNRKHLGILYYDKKNINLVWSRSHDSIFVTDIYNKKTINSYQLNGINALGQLGDDLYGFSNKQGIFKLQGDKFEIISNEKIEGSHSKVIASPNNKYLVIKTEKNLYYFKDRLIPIKKGLTLIRDIIFDKEGNLWVATEEGLYNFFQLNFVNYTFGKGNKDWVWTILEDENKNMWFSSFQNGIWKWDGNIVNDYSEQINKMRKRLYGISYPCTYFMGGSKFGKSLYFPTNNSVIEYRDGTFKRVKGISNITNKAYFITKTFDDGTLYCGGMPGLFEINPNKTNRYWPHDSLDISTILSVERNLNKDLIVVGSSGIAKIVKDSIVYIQKHSTQNNFCSTKDHRNNIWIGGNQKLELLADDTIRNIVPNSNESYFSLLFVEPHYLLIGGINGLYIANLNDYYQNNIFEPILYNQHNGFTGIECGQNGFFTDSDGYVWINTSDLVTRFDPLELINNKPTPPTLFVKTKMSSDNIYWQTLKPETNYLLKHNQNNFNFSADVISFSNTGNIRYYYRLSGLQAEWTKAVTNSEINFYNLKPGKYQFSAKVDPGTSSVMSEIVSVNFEIEKPFWISWWFITGSVLFFLAIIGFIIFLFYQRIRKKELIKKKIVQLRADALKSQMNPHLIYNALNNINGLINLGHKQEAQNYLNTFSDLLRLVLESTNKNEIPLKNELDIIRSFVAFHKQAKARKFDLKIQLDLEEDVNHILIPPVLIQPYVENAILHGFSKSINKGLILVVVQTNGNRLLINIEDNGVGIGNSSYKGHGLGTKLTNERIKLLEKKPENRVNIVKLENGTKVTINIPLKLLK